MEVIGFNGTVITSLFNVSNHDGARPVVEFAREVVERYKFVTTPKLEELFSDKTIFQNGVFQGAAIDALEVYRDGVIIRGRCDSDVLDAFLEDVIGWYMTKTGSRRIETRRVSTSYESTLAVLGSDKMLRTLEPIKEICRGISAALEATNGTTAEYVPFGFSLAADDTINPGLKPIPFRLERQLGSEFDRNIFVSAAPLRTKDHVKLLQALDR
jgi:hypothetical protein